MNRKELLEFMKPRISQYHYDILEVWSKNREKRFFLFNSNFDIQSTVLNNGYIVKVGFMLDYILVYV